MKNRLIYLGTLLCAALLTGLSAFAPADAQQACQWNSTFINGVATATYCGNVVVVGTITGGGGPGGITPIANGGTGVSSLPTGALKGNGGSAITQAGAADLTNGVSGSGAVALVNGATLIAPNLGTPASGVATNLTGTAAGLTAGSVTTNANLTGPITSTGNATAIGAQTGTGSTFVMSLNPTITGPTLTTPALGTIASGVATNLTGTAAGLTAGSVTTNANLTGPITSSGNATAIASQTGTGTKFVVDTSPTLVTPNIGTPSAGVATNLTGTAAGLTAGNVTTNANLTGVITSVGNATSIASQTGTGTQFVTSGGTPVTANLSVTGKLNSTYYVANSSGVTATGSCAINSQIGGVTAGKFAANGACVAGTVIFSFSATATNGWACTAKDLTTPANLLNQTAFSTTGVTFTGTLTSADVVTYICMGF